MISAAGGANVPGWVAICPLVGLLAGIQLVGIGVVGEYVGKAYTETKRRPPYFIAETTLAEDEKENMEPGTVAFDRLQ